MKNNLFIQTLIILVVLFSCSFNSNKKKSPDKPISFTIALELIASDLEAPVGMAVPNDNSNRLFVIEQPGQIRVIKKGVLMEQPFLDLTINIDKLSPFYSEKGLLGLAFHPQYSSNGKFYVYYSAESSSPGMDHKSVIAEYTVSSNPDLANNNGRILLQIEEPESNHNGGCLAFGPDGFLYIGTGDGGGAGDQHGSTGSGQNLNTLLGKILRIDVNAPAGYHIPPDNPFVNKTARPEIWAYGLRNPWRFSFDQKTGELYCGDVGQNEWEEVSLIEKGKNYGWRIMEGNHCYDPSSNCNSAGLILPIAEYSHKDGKSVIGGYVYRGILFPDMASKYIFGDWTGLFYMLSKSTATDEWLRYSFTVKNPSGDFYINSFGEDEQGELYVLGQSSIGPRKSGQLYQIAFE